MTVNKASFTDGGNTEREAVLTGTNAGADPTAALQRPRIALIWAMARNRVIGRHNALPWHLPVDMKHFRELTTGHPVLMGRNTFESLGRPLPNRANIVISSDFRYAPPGVQVAHTLDEALQLAVPHVPRDHPEIFVIGGEKLYSQMLPCADRLYVTLIDAEIEGDAWFPEFELGAWREIERDLHVANDRNPFACTFLTLERKTPR